MWGKSKEERFVAFKSLLVTYLKDLERFVYIVTNKNNQIKDEIVQNAFVSAMEHWQQLRDWDRMKSWLFSIAKNEAKIYYRKNPFSTEFEDEILFLENAEASQTLLMDVSNLLVNEETSRELNAAILQLNENEQRIIMMYHYLDIDLKEIAEILNINYNTVRTLHRRSLEKLKRMLLKQKGSAVND